MIILAAWLSKKINSPWLAALLGVVLIGVAIYGLATDQIATILAILIIAVGVMNLLRLLPPVNEKLADDSG
jgi:hypothetical protein